MPDFRPAPVYSPRWPAPPKEPVPRNYTRRAAKLRAAHESAITALAGTKSLRSLAADFGVSHETIRAVLRRREKDRVGVPS